MSNANTQTLERSRRFAWISTWWIELTAGLVALGIGIYQLSLPHAFSGVLPVTRNYDEGVYIGVAIRLVHGVLPYRDFVFIHPPGIALLMSPVALFGAVVGSSASSLIIARVLTLIVVAINAVLVGRLVRPIGRVAVVIASFSLALWPLSVGVDRDLELEPYLVLFCLVGALLVFKTNGNPSMRRVFLGGLAFGFAFAVKVWAFMPIAAVLLVMLPRWRREGRWLVLGMATAALLAYLPFFLAAPHAFVHDVFVSPLSQQSASSAASFGQILLMISGFAGLTATAVPSWVAGLAFLLVAAAVGVVYGIGGRSRTRLEWYILASAVITFFAMLNAAFFTDHYAYFPLAMLAPLLGVCAGRLWGYATNAMARHRISAARSRVVAAVSLAVVLGLAIFLVDQDASYDQNYTSGASSVSALDTIIPAGACVLSDVPPALVMADRITPSHSGCPADIDPYAMYLSDDDGSYPHVGGPFLATFKLLWFSELQRADYVVLRIPLSDFIPWTTPMINWFQQNYVQVGTVPQNDGYPFYIYRRVGL